MASGPPAVALRIRPPIADPQVGHPAMTFIDDLHDAPAAMAIPLVVLAIGSVFAGYLGVPAALGGSNFIEHFLAPSLLVPAIEGVHAAEHVDHRSELLLMIVSSIIALLGIGAAAYLYLKRPQMPDMFSARFPASIGPS